MFRKFLDIDEPTDEKPDVQFDADENDADNDDTTCETCGRTFHTSDDLDYHVKHKHNSTFGMNVEDTDDDSASIEVESVGDSLTKRAHDLRDRVEDIDLSTDAHSVEGDVSFEPSPTILADGGEQEQDSDEDLYNCGECGDGPFDKHELAAHAKNDHIKADRPISGERLSTDGDGSDPNSDPDSDADDTLDVSDAIVPPDVYDDYDDERLAPSNPEEDSFVGTLKHISKIVTNCDDPLGAEWARIHFDHLRKHYEDDDSLRYAFWSGAYMVARYGEMMTSLGRGIVREFKEFAAGSSNAMVAGAKIAGGILALTYLGKPVMWSLRILGLSKFLPSLSANADVSITQSDAAVAEAERLADEGYAGIVVDAEQAAEGSAMVSSGLMDIADTLLGVALNPLTVFAIGALYIGHDGFADWVNTQVNRVTSTLSKWWSKTKDFLGLSMDDDSTEQATLDQATQSA